MKSVNGDISAAEKQPRATVEHGVAAESGRKGHKHMGKSTVMKE